ncbi:MAG: DNA adenine methylase [Candidatus Nanopelagicaceae bacterium]
MAQDTLPGLEHLSQKPVNVTSKSGSKHLSQKPVNISSIPQRSPFRYPGGKTWLVPRVRQWLGSQAVTPKNLIEPFAGGGIVSLTAVAEGLAEHVTMVEIDEQVGAVWQTILNKDCGWLIQQIGEFKPTFESVAQRLSKVPQTTRERAFQTIVKNRTYHGGILAAGSAPLKNGENGKGITSRWYPETLQKRIAAIHEMREKITFIQGDGIEVMLENAHLSDTVHFIDPPYTAPGKGAGRRLYTHFVVDHNELFRISAKVKGDLLMTYDNEYGALELAKSNGFETRVISMQNTHLATMTELLIGRDLNWAV